MVNFLLERQTVRVLTGAPASEPPLVVFTEVGGWMLASTREQLSAWRIAEQYRLKAEAGEDKKAYAKREMFDEKPNPKAKWLTLAESVSCCTKRVRS